MTEASRIDELITEVIAECPVAVELMPVDEVQQTPHLRRVVNESSTRHDMTVDRLQPLDVRSPLRLGILETMRLVCEDYVPLDLAQLVYDPRPTVVALTATIICRLGEDVVVCKHNDGVVDVAALQLGEQQTQVCRE